MFNDYILEILKAQQTQNLIVFQYECEKGFHEILLIVNIIWPMNTNENKIFSISFALFFITKCWLLELHMYTHVQPITHTHSQSLEWTKNKYSLIIQLVNKNNNMSNNLPFYVHFVYSIQYFNKFQRVRSAQADANSPVITHFGPCDFVKRIKWNTYVHILKLALPIPSGYFVFFDCEMIINYKNIRGFIL